MFAALAAAAEHRIAEFKLQELANTAWAFATTGHLDLQLLAALAKTAEQRVGEFNAQDLGNTV